MMQVGSWNCTGCDFRSSRFRTWLSPLHLAAVQETFKTSPQLSVPGFQTFVSPASRKPLPTGSTGSLRGRAKGGLASFVSTQLSAFYNVDRVALEVEHVESLVLHFTRKSSAPVDDSAPTAFLFANCYVRPLPDAVDFELLFAEVDALGARFDCPLLIAGDFNAHLPHPRVPTLHPTPRDVSFYDFVTRLESVGFTYGPGPENARPTFLGGNSGTFIDFVFARGVNFDPVLVSTLTVTGHRALTSILRWPAPVPVSLTPRQSHRRHFHSEVPPNFFSRFVADGITGCVEFIRAGVGRVYSLFLMMVLSLTVISRPPARPRESWHRYLSQDELAPLLTQEDALRLAASQPVECLDFVNLRNERRAVAILRKELHLKAVSRLFTDTARSFNNPTQLWDMVKRFRGTAATGGVPVHILRDHFVAVFNRVTDPLPLTFFDPRGYVTTAIDRRFTMAELDKALSELKRDKAPGPNGIGNDVLLALAKLDDGRLFFLNLFNACFESGAFPDPWRTSEIFVLYKGKGDVLDPNSYRGIALLDSCFKLYERLLYHRLRTWAFARGCIPPAQFGFRANSGTLDAAFTFATLIMKYVFVRCSPLFAALIDFQKAFPSVHRAKLLSKLERMGIPRKFLRALGVMFSGNTFCLRAEDCVTEAFPVITGLREGGVLSPLLFSLFISDMEESVLCPFTEEEFARTLCRDPELHGTVIPGLLYADDLILFALSENALRLRLTRLKRYAISQSLTVNVKKSEIVVFGLSRPTFVFRFNGDDLPLRRSCKYLGIWFASSGSWAILQKELTAKFQAAVVSFFSLCRKLRISRLDHVHKLSQSLLFSVLYGAEFITDVSFVPCIENLFVRGVRKFYGLPNGVSNVAIRLLFPDVCVASLLLRNKFSLLLRALKAGP